MRARRSARWRTRNPCSEHNCDGIGCVTHDTKLRGITQPGEHAIKPMPVVAVPRSPVAAHEHERGVLRLFSTEKRKKIQIYL